MKLIYDLSSQQNAGAKLRFAPAFSTSPHYPLRPPIVDIVDSV